MIAVLVDGVAFGLQLSLLAVGLTLVYGLGGVLNLAHGQFAAFAAIVGARMIAGGAPVPVAVVGALLAAGILALAVDATLMRPVYRLHGDARVLLSLLLTLGVAFTLDGLLVVLAPFTLLNLAIPGPALALAGVPLRRGTVVAALVAIAVLSALIVHLRFTRSGRAIRSVIEDPEGAQLCGVDPSRVRRLVFVFSGVLAGLVAITQGMLAPIGASSGRDLTVLALIVTVVGGLGRVSGAMVAGILLGVVHAVASYAIGTVVTFVLLLLAAIAVILLRPSGILARPG